MDHHNNDAQRSHDACVRSTLRCTPYPKQLRHIQPIAVTQVCPVRGQMLSCFRSCLTMSFELPKTVYAEGFRLLS